MKRYLEILGFKVVDRVTGFEGVATAVSFDLPGCVMVTVSPPVDPTTKKAEESRWFDHKRMAIISDQPVMKPPTFDEPGDEAGGVDKPPMPNGRG